MEAILERSLAASNGGHFAEELVYRRRQGKAIVRNFRRGCLGVHERDNGRRFCGQDLLWSGGRWGGDRRQTHLLSGDDVLALQLHDANLLRVGAGELVVAPSSFIPVTKVIDAILAAYGFACDARKKWFDGAVGGNHCGVVGLVTVALFDTEHNADSALVHGVPPQSCRKVPQIFG